MKARRKIVLGSPASKSAILTRVNHDVLPEACLRLPGGRKNDERPKVIRGKNLPRTLEHKPNYPILFNKYDNLRSCNTFIIFRSTVLPQNNLNLPLEMICVILLIHDEDRNESIIVSITFSSVLPSRVLSEDIHR